MYELSSLCCKCAAIFDAIYSPDYRHMLETHLKCAGCGAIVNVEWVNPKRKKIEKKLAGNLA